MASYMDICRVIELCNAEGASREIIVYLSGLAEKIMIERMKYFVHDFCIYSTDTHEFIEGAERITKEKALELLSLQGEDYNPLYWSHNTGLMWATHVS